MLILDEATEHEIIAAIDRLFAERTRILVSHRPATLAAADMRFELAGGRLSLATGQHTSRSASV
jgi:ATP-binding cassette subfamily B protein